MLDTDQALDANKVHSFADVFVFTSQTPEKAPNITELTLSQKTRTLPHQYPLTFLFVAAVVWWLQVHVDGVVADAHHV